MNIKMDYRSAQDNISKLKGVGDDIDSSFPSSDNLINNIKNYNSNYFDTMKNHVSTVVEKTKNYCSTSNKYISDIIAMNKEKIEISEIQFGRF